jgi:hypothetical protein
VNNQLVSSSQRGNCRFCATPLRQTFVDLGMSPLCQTHIEPDQLDQMEPFYPLHVRICESCFLVQLDVYVSPTTIFSDYSYFSSYSDSWVEHARLYADEMREQYQLGADSFVVEIASNDGYLLQHLARAGIPVRGIEPAANVAAAARDKGIPTSVEFFGRETAERFASQYGRPDLLLGNNVLAHVPNINDFVAGLQVLLAEEGVITMEFPHLQRLMEGNQFDTIYHEHFSYLSFTTVERIFAAHGLVLFDVAELPTHGGSLRIFARHERDPGKPITNRVTALRSREERLGYGRLETYLGFGKRVEATKRDLLRFLVQAKDEGRKIAGYGAPGKGNTLLNYCGIRTDFLDFTVDRSPHKQGRYTPGTRIPILDPATIREAKPDYLLVLPWNLRDEIVGQTSYIREWGGRWVFPIPELAVID